MITAGAVCAALNGIGEDAATKGCVVDAGGDVQGGIERLTGFCVAYEFDAEKKTHAANVADDGRFVKRSEGGAKLSAFGFDGCDEIVLLQIIEDSQACGGGNRMSAISEAVEQGAGAAFDGGGDASGDDDGTERSVAAGEAFASENDVGLDAPMIDGKIFAGATDAGHHFVGDEENVVLAANVGDAGQVFGRRRGSTESGSRNWLDKKRGDFFRADGGDLLCEIVGAGDPAFRIMRIERTAIAVAGNDMAPILQERKERSTALDVS